MANEKQNPESEIKSRQLGYGELNGVPMVKAYGDAAEEIFKSGVLGQKAYRAFIYILEKGFRIKHYGFECGVRGEKVSCLFRTFPKGKISLVFDTKTKSIQFLRSVRNSQGQQQDIALSHAQQGFMDIAVFEAMYESFLKQ